MKLRIPPAVVFIFFLGLMYLLAAILPAGNFDFFGRRVLIYVLIILAIVIAVWSLGIFFGKSTTVDPINVDKANTLVTSGIYRYSRNPMYLAMLLLLIAFGLHLQNAFNTLLAAGFVYVMNHFQIKREEEALLDKFGKDYRLYLKAVRRWF